MRPNDDAKEYANDEANPDFRKSPTNFSARCVSIGVHCGATVAKH
jgi:hypothetical protein